VLRYDGILPNVFGPDGKPADAGVEEVRALARWVAERRPADAGPFDVVVEGQTAAGDPQAAADMVRPWREAGATWWIEGMWSVQGSPEEVERVTERLLAGPPPG
jgi:hypothetical protein